LKRTGGISLFQQTKEIFIFSEKDWRNFILRTGWRKFFAARNVLGTFLSTQKQTRELYLSSETGNRNVVVL
jgi:hypothetical protein